MIGGFRKVGRPYRYLLRYKKIITVLIKYGFSDIISQTRIDKYFKISRRVLFRKQHPEIGELSRWERIRMVIEELGPSFIKFGQVLSNRPDIVPQELIFELEKLLESAPTFPTDDAITLIERELNDKIDNIFDEFNPQPIASASIAQVYRARLKNGDMIVIKVQRPGIKRQIEIDLEIMLHLASLMERYVEEIRAINPVSVVKEFGVTIRKEIDFHIECSHIKRFNANFEKNSLVVVPDVYKSLSTKKILVLQYIDGISIGNIKALQKSGINLKKLAAVGTKLIFEQIFIHGFFHADPHPGNIFILSDGRICFLDFGMMGVLLPKYREYLGDFIIGFVNSDVRKIAKTLLKLSINHEALNIDLFEARISELIEQFTYLPLKEIDMGEIISRALEVVIEYRIQMPPAIYLLSKAMITIEGVARKLEPDFDIIGHFKPYAKKLLKERLSPLKLAKANYFSLIELSNLVSDMPFEIREIMAHLKQGDIAFTIREKDSAEKLSRYEKIGNRLSLALIISTLLVCSTVFFINQTPPLHNGLSVFGLLGFATGGSLFIWLLIAMIRKK